MNRRITFTLPLLMAILMNIYPYFCISCPSSGSPATAIDPMIVQRKGKQKFTKRTFHSLRHGFISALANSGVSEEVRMKLTGHTSFDMDKKYTHLSTEPLKQSQRDVALPDQRPPHHDFVRGHASEFPPVFD